LRVVFKVKINLVKTIDSVWLSLRMSGTWNNVVTNKIIYLVNWKQISACSNEYDVSLEKKSQFSCIYEHRYRITSIFSLCVQYIHIQYWPNKYIGRKCIMLLKKSTTTKHQSCICYSHAIQIFIDYNTSLILCLVVN
jgi:hypothetical protein